MVYCGLGLSVLAGTLGRSLWMVWRKACTSGSSVLLVSGLPWGSRSGLPWGTEPGSLGEAEPDLSRYAERTYRNVGTRRRLLADSAIGMDQMATNRGIPRH